MGSFFTNYQIRHEDSKRVEKACKPLIGKGHAYISPPLNGWITLYDEQSDTQDDAVLRRTAMGLSRALASPVFAFLVHDSDVLLYFLYDRGQLVDEFNSAPDYFGDAAKNTAPTPAGGDADALLPYCLPGTSREKLQAVLNSASRGSGAETVLIDLAEMLGIDEQRVATGFRYLIEDSPEDRPPDAGQFQPLGKGTQKLKRATATTTPAASGSAAALEQYPQAVALVAARWAPSPHPSFALSPALGQKVAQRFLDAARQMLKYSAVAGRPTVEELSAAADNGPAALAQLSAHRTPQWLPQIAASAAAINIAPFVEALLDVGFDVNYSDPSGDPTLLMLVARHGNVETLRRLIKLGAELNRQERQGDTALHYAAVAKQTSAVRLLLEHGADHTTKNTEGQTARDAAEMVGASDVVAAIEEA